MANKLSIIFFVIFFSFTSLFAQSINFNQSQEILFQTSFLCYPHLTNQDSINECFTYTIFGINDSDEINWFDEGISYHFIFYNESYDLGFTEISYDEYIEVKDKLIEYAENNFDVLEGGDESRYGYNSKEKDSTNLNYYGARYYKSSQGQFVQADPVISDLYDQQGLNRYAYVRNNPYKYTDPTGNYIETAIDVGFISYDLYQIQQDPSFTNYAALAGDVAGAALPGVTGLGAGVRIGSKGLSKANDITKTANKLSPHQIGKIGENKLIEEFGGKSQVTFKTDLGGRRFDQFSLDTGIGREAKTGYQSLTKHNKAQIDKTSALINSPQSGVKSSEIHFFDSPVTNRGGASKNLQEYSTSKGIKTILNKLKSKLGGSK